MLTTSSYANEGDCEMTPQLKWAAHPNPSQVIVEPLGKDEIELLDQYAQQIVSQAQSLGSQIEYNQHGLSIVNTMINSLKDKLPDSEMNRIAHFTGAFYGKVIISQYTSYSPSWVRSEQQVAVILNDGDKKALLYPISRAMKQLNDGSDYSIKEQFDSIPEIVCSLKL